MYQKTPYTSIYFIWMVSFLFLAELSFAQVDNVPSSKFSMNINGYTLKIPYYANADLSISSSDFEQAVVVIHGTNRNADEYFQTLKTAATRSSADLEHILIVAPQFLTEADLNFHSLDAQHLYWTDGGWKSGSNSRDENASPRPERIPSYAVLDSLLLHVARQFPGLESIVLTGHSAGAQVVQRMAATSPLANDLCSDFDINLRFVVANPSSYVYLDNQRRVSGSKTQFAVPLSSCNDFNDWKYGLDNLYTYPRLSSVETIRKRFKHSIVTYLLGTSDNDPNSSSIDNTCEARLQGAHRYERGEIYFNYLQHYYGPSITANQELVTVPGVGHNHFAMYTSDPGLFTLFEKPAINCQTIVSSVAIPKGSEVTIHPNPANGQLSVTISPFSNQQLKLFIFDLQGRLLLNRGIHSIDQIDITPLNSGLYFLLIQSDKTTFRKRFVVN